MKPNLGQVALSGLVFGAALAFPTMAQAQQALHINPALIMHQDEQSLAEHVNQLTAEMAILKAQLSADEKKLAEAAQTANDAKMGVGLAVTGVNNQLNTLSSNVSALQASSVQAQSDLNTLRSSYLAHTHDYSRTSIGFTNIPLGGGAYASLIQKNIQVPETTSPPK